MIDGTFVYTETNIPFVVVAECDNKQKYLHATFTMIPAVNYSTGAGLHGCIPTIAKILQMNPKRFI